MGTGGTVKINGGDINLTGAISFSDLSDATTKQQEIDNISNTATSALSTANSAQSLANTAITDASDAYDAATSAQDVAKSIANGSYLKGTFINGKKISSPEIEGNNIKVYGTFQTIGNNGDSQVTTGYMGAAKGLDAQGNDTYGVALSYAWNSSTLEVSDKYLIVTNGGVRMQAGNHSMTITSNGCYVDGKLIGTAGSTAVFG